MTIKSLEILDVRLMLRLYCQTLSLQCECAICTESIYQSVENLREETTKKNTKHQETLTAAQISRSMRHQEK
jgi:hypothetical protein